MSEDFGSDFITIIDDEGSEIELEVLDRLDWEGASYMAFLPADMDEEDPDFGMIILRVVEDENGEELFESVDEDELLETLHGQFIQRLFDGEEPEDED